MERTTGMYSLPSPDQVGKAAYARWERRGYSHGSDREDWLAAECELIFSLNYRTIAREQAGGASAIPSPLPKTARRCRFCESAEPRTRFSRYAESSATPWNFLLGRTDVCDECTENFREKLEVELKDFWRTLESRMSGEFTGPGPSLVVFKALTWLALALMPERSLELFGDAIEWGGNPDHEVDASLFGSLQCLVYRLDELNDQHWASIEQKRDEDVPLPSFVFTMVKGPYAILATIPLSTMDQELDVAPRLVGRWWCSSRWPGLDSSQLLLPVRSRRGSRPRLTT